MTLARMQSSSGMYGLLNLAETEAMTHLLGLNLQEVSNLATMKSIVSEMVTTLSRECSGLILDHRTGLESLTTKAPAIGVGFRLLNVMPLEDTLPHPQLPQVLPNWGVEAIKNNFGVAVLELNYHPQEQLAVDKKKLCYEIADFCHFEGIEMILDLRITGINGGKIHPDDLAEAQIAAVEELQRFAPLLIVDFPGTVLATATLTAELDVPWLLADRGGDYDDYKVQMRQALENGARGFVIGKSLWQELTTLRLPDMSPDQLKIAEFVHTTMRDRLIEVMRITEEAGQKN